MKKIGFIGVGIMGKSMVRNLMKQDMNCIFTQEQKRKSMM